MSLARRLVGGVVISLSCTGLAAAGPEAALAEGNRRFARDRIEAALESYAQGYTGDGSPLDGVLAYNAGTCALRLGRLPEALLWYRRAEVAAPGDPWLRDNLEATRQALGEPQAQTAWGILSAKRHGLAVAGVALGWAAVFLLVLLRRFPRRLLVLLGALSCGAFGTATLLDRVGPRAAVLLEPCQAPGIVLPAGSEVWVRPAAPGGWHVLGMSLEVRCAALGVGLVEP